jgi:hypothetical protein
MSHTKPLGTVLSIRHKSLIFGDEQTRRRIDRRDAFYLCDGSLPLIRGGNDAICSVTASYYLDDEYVIGLASSSRHREIDSQESRSHGCSRSKLDGVY